MPCDTLRYTRCAVIVHGKSEFHLVRFVYTNLHLPVKIISENKGRGSIQINGLKDYLNKKPFVNLSVFAKEYLIEYDKKARKLKNFKLFIIMDTDDCSEEIKKGYVSGEMFRGHPLQEYIVPIYNIANLEDVMIKAGIMTKRIPDSQKGTYYSKIFPINTEPLSSDTLKQIRTFASKIRNVKQTNMLEFIEYCFEQIPNENLWEEGGQKPKSR